MIAPTPREQQLLEMMARGMTSTHIAAELGTSRYTVMSQRKTLLDKYDCRDTRQIVEFAYKHGLLQKVDGRLKPLSDFGPQEQQILRMIRKSPEIPHKDIAEALGIGPKTVETHLYRIRRKLQLGPNVRRWCLPGLVGGWS